MLGVFLILILAIWLAFLPLELPRKEPVEHSAKFDNQMKQLWGIAQKKLGNGARWQEISKLNGLTSTTIVVGQKLKIPS